MRPAHLVSNSREEQDAPEAAINPLAKECPYCQSRDIVKRGWRKKKYEKAQLYFCNKCAKTFTAQRIKGKSFPLRVILEGLSAYNLGYSLEDSCQRLKEEFGLNITGSTLNEWVKEFAPLCRYARLRPYGLKLFGPNQVIQTVHLYHHQVYDFSVHRAKLALLLQEYRNNKFDNLREFLEAIQSECPHQFFQDGERASELKVDFSLEEVVLKEKQNFATRLADLALQAVSDNKLRHKTLQNFMLANDSVTVAVEVPVYMDEMDVEHMQEELGFKIPLKLDRVLTGHIDILQLRNGAVHILDYKPQGAKEKIGSRALTQLTLYALMLSRLTGLRLYDFKCAWFDENSYFEFFPLHVVYKLRERARKEHPDQLKFEEVSEATLTE
ncbi:MAG: PD-(D/E)XK nuclease family protein [Candidatus Omnitrophota bacterium]|nr:PD-(D/E)XK nuclease family protein [Candidatus Omnitrophota bacterium]